MTTTADRTAPMDHGERLLTISRSESEELRVSIAEYKGYRFLSIRVWTRSVDGQWWPDAKKGVTIKPRELEQFGAAVGIAQHRFPTSSDRD